MKRILKKIFSRFSFVGISIVLLFILNFVLVAGVITVAYLAIDYHFPTVGEYLAIGLTALSWVIVVITVLHAANRDMVPETKIPWILCIVALNVFGVAIYITFSSRRPRRRMRNLYKDLHDRSVHYGKRVFSKEETEERLGSWASVSEALCAENPAALLMGRTATEYIPTGEAFLERLLSDLEKAEKFIFIETFVLAKGKLLSSLLDVLERKVQAGVEVRMMYDDVGSMSRVHFRYHKELQKRGIACVKFNPFVPVVTNLHNNRDHRKIAVIDGKVAYTGGINLADEYANFEQPFGYWKDSAVRLEGAGVRSLTLLFLRLYDLQTRRTEDYSKYIPEEEIPQNTQAGAENSEAETNASEPSEIAETPSDPSEGEKATEEEGYVQPYGDGPFPLYGKHLGEDLYINILNTAKRYVWISTPYLIIDYRMREALALAAKRGVDVRILTPHIPDKKIAFALTRSNYSALIDAGVKIYEYIPGFVHAKSFVADDEAAVVGTVNLDYRSFLFHFEDGVFMVKTKAIEGLKADMEESFSSSRLLTPEDAKKNVVWRFVCEIAKIFAPLF